MVWSVIFATLLSVAAAGSIRGDATFTGGSASTGTCSFKEYSFPPNIFGTGIGPSNWNTGGLCGACLQVDGPQGSVRVMVADSCPTCKENRLNLYSEAFERIGNRNNGIVDVSFDIVSCGVTTPLTVRNKEGTSRWFFSMQVQNCNFPIVALDVSTDGTNSWQPTVRQNYNYFEREGKGGFDSDRVTVRISCSNGRQVIIPDVSMEGEAETMAPVNC